MKKIKIPALLLLSCTIAWGQVSEQETAPAKLGKPQVTQIKSLGENINTAASELLPVLSPDGNSLYFSRESKETGATTENIWVSDKAGESWGEPVQLISPFGTNGSHYVLQYLPAEGKKLPMLILGNNYGKGTHETPLMYSYSKDNGKTWGKPKEIKIQNVEGFKQRTVCYLTLDRQHLLLSMTYKDGFGGDDIYVCTATGEGKFGPPANMGDGINSEADETAPFLSPDGNMLYFSSNNPGSSHGELDLYVSARLSESSWNEWSAPVNLGGQINTPFDDTDFFITSDGTAYFSRGVDEENDDLYQAKVNYISPNSIVTVKGKMLNKEKQPVAGRIAVERSSNGQWVNMVDNDPATGEYTMQVQGADKYEMYGIVGDSHSEKVNLDLSAIATGEKEAPVIYISKEQALALATSRGTTTTPGGNSKTPIADKPASGTKARKPIAAPTDFASAATGETILEPLTPKEEKVSKPASGTKTRKPTAAPTDVASTATSETISAPPASKEEKVSPPSAAPVAVVNKSEASDKKEEVLKEVSPDALGVEPAPETTIAKTKKERKEKRRASRKKSEEIQPDASLAENPTPSPENPNLKPAEVASSVTKSDSTNKKEELLKDISPDAPGAEAAPETIIAKTKKERKEKRKSSHKKLEEIQPDAAPAPSDVVSRPAEKAASPETLTPTESPSISASAKVSKPVSETPAPAGAGIGAKKIAENPAPVVSKNAAVSPATSSSSLSGSSNKVLFEVNQAIVSPEYLEELDRVASELASQPSRTVRLAGYADPTGPSDWNLDLSKRRAKAVAKYLKKKGVSSSQIDLHYYGEKNSKGLPRSAGRRVEISFEEGMADEQIINFKFNRDVVGESYQALLDKVAVQVQNGGVVQLSGYTDSSGPNDYNMSLSKRRAQAVAKALKSRGVPAEKIITHYYGAENPIDPARKSRNRRVEIRIN